MSQIIVSISSTGHDRCIAVMEDYKLKAIFQEDRFSRVKNDERGYLTSLEQLPKILNKIDHLILTGWAGDFRIYVDFLSKHNLTPGNITEAPPTHHHVFHAASGFFGSGFRKAICLTIDAWGGITSMPKNSKVKDGRYTTTIQLINSPSDFKEKYTNIWFDPYFLDNEFNSSNIEGINDYNSNLDIGNMYHIIGKHIGFHNISDSGKIMGLSAYGKPNPNLPSLLYKDTLYGDSNIFTNNLQINTKLNPGLREVTKEKAMDLAFSIQKSLEKVILERIKQAISYSNTNNLVLSGGCFMNVVCNYLIKKHFPKLNIYVDPMATDSGLAYGAAKYYYYQATGSNKLDPLNHLYWGPRYSKKTLLNSIQKYV